MKTYDLLGCDDSNVRLPIRLYSLGYERDSVYYLYFLDHTKEREGANVLELLASPFQWNEIDRLYTITIKLKNIPHATAHALQVLAEHEVNVRTTSATDSIAGRIGSIDAVVALPDALDGLRAVDGLFEDVYSRNENDIQAYIDPTEYHAPSEFVDGRYNGKFITGRKYLGNFEIFRRRIAAGVNGDEAELKDIDGSPVISIPEAVLTYLNQKYGRPREARLGDYYAALTTDSEFNSLSLSFLDPNEIIVHLDFVVEDRARLFHALSDFLGQEQVNFRIVYVKSIIPGQIGRIQLTCDISYTEYPLYSIITMRRILLAQAWTALKEVYHDAEAEPPRIHRFDVTPRYGYPLELKNFGAKDRFSLVDIFCYAVDGDHEGAAGPGLREQFRLSTLFESFEQIGTSEAFDSEAQRLSNEASVAATRVAGYVLGLESARKDAAPLLEEATEEKLQSPGSASGMLVTAGNRRYLCMYGSRFAACLVCDNQPPRNLQERFFAYFDSMVVDGIDRDEFEQHSLEFLSQLSYHFPTVRKFERFETKPQAEFVESARRRFGAVGGSYIREKYEVDEFPVMGNRHMARLTRPLLKNLAQKSGSRVIRIADLGPGAGALTMLFIADICYELGILDRVSLTLVDVSPEVLQICTQGSFEIPAGLVDESLSITPTRYKTFLAKARPVLGDVNEVAIPEEGEYDLVVTGFMLHHMNGESRKRACSRICKLARPGGFVGIVDELMTYPLYLQYLTNHLADKVDPARESFLRDPQELVSILESNGVRKPQVTKGDRYYLICGTKSATSQEITAPKQPKERDERRGMDVF